MTKKDFVVIADIIKAMPKNIRTPLMQVAIESLQRKYPNFDPISFRNYIEEK